jgi:preprotein translocase subunit SecD
MIKRTVSWKSGLLLGIFLLGLVYALPNLFSEQIVLQIAPAEGSQLFSLESVRTQLSHQVQAVLAKAQLPASVEDFDNHTLTLRFQDVNTQLKARDSLSAELGATYTVAVKLLSTTPTFLQNIGASPMKLGLDLRGGIHFVLAMDIDTLQAVRLRALIREISEHLRQAKIPYLTLFEQEGAGVLRFRDVVSAQAAYPLLTRKFPDLTLHPLTGAEQTTLQLRFSTQSLQSHRQRALEQTMVILRNRVNALGIAEPLVQQLGEDRIIVDLPGIQDITRAQQILGGTATLAFRLVAAEPPAGQTSVVSPSSYTYQGYPIELDKRVLLTGESIMDAKADQDSMGRPVVNVVLEARQARHFRHITAKHIGQLMAILYKETQGVMRVVEGKSVYTPQKIERIISVARITNALGEQFQITGFSEREAVNLALLLRAGALPTPIYIVEQTTIGPQLGAENIQLGLRAIIGGFLLTVLFMGFYYRQVGWIANLVLLINLILLVALLSLLGMTLTLPGMAGILLTVALAVDATVLIFERIREELRQGVSVRLSIERGYTRAWTTILDANVATLIVASVLFFAGTGPIKGFAVILAAGIFTSLLSAVSFSRVFLNYFYGARHIRHLPIGIKNLSSQCP